MRINFEEEKTIDRARQVSNCVKGISHEIRLAIVFSLRRGERNVGELVTTIGCPQPTLSQHLSVMRDRGILESRRKGTQVYYRVSDKRIFKLISLIKELFCNR